MWCNCFGQGFNSLEPSENVWPMVFVAQSYVEDVVTPLAVDFSFLQSAQDSFSFSVGIFGTVKMLILAGCQNGWLPSLKVLLPLMAWHFQVMKVRLLSYFLELKRIVLGVGCQNRVCKEPKLDHVH